MAWSQLALIGGVAVLSSAAPADVSSLVQKGVQLHADASACKCVGWKDAYSKLGAKCGGGHELDIVPMPGFMARMIPQMSYEFCQMYFSNLPNDNYCMNTKFGQQSPTEWCYVRADCVGSGKNGTLQTKSCTRGQDATLGEMRFEDFAAYAHRSKLELGLMTQFAFPTWEGEKLPDVQAFWGLPAPADAKPISEELRGRLQAVVDSGKTMFFVSRDGHPPYGVVEGKKLYYINFDPQSKPDFAHKEDMNQWRCVAGCGEANKPIW